MMTETVTSTTSGDGTGSMATTPYGIQANATNTDISMTSTELTRPAPSAPYKQCDWRRRHQLEYQDHDPQVPRPGRRLHLRCNLGFQLRGQQGREGDKLQLGAGGGYNQALKDAIEATHAIVSCAAGNSGDNTDINPHYPSSYDSDNIISVAAMMQNDTPPCNYSGWWSTCWGPETVDLYAPGGYILSTIPPDPPPTEPGEAYDFFYGTSMATPHVSGTAALIHSLRPSVALYPPGAPDGAKGGIRQSRT